MKFTKIGMLVVMCVVSSVVLAEGGGDRTFARMMQANDQAMAKYTAKHAEEEKGGKPVSSDEKTDESTKKK